ncbi:MAG: D-glycerate dehydrogenase [Gemmatimonadales bacterium]
MTARPRVHVTRRLVRAVEEQLGQWFDAVIPESDQPSTPLSLQRALGDADALLCTLTDRITGEVLAAYPLRTRIIASYGAGTDHIDLDAARAHGIVVTNTPDVLTDCTADLTIMLILMALRRAGEGERELRSGTWQGWHPTHLLGRRVGGATLGLVGTGRIARAVARRAIDGFGMRVRYHNPHHPAVAELDALGAAPCGSLGELLAGADVISLHCPSTPDTRGLINAERIAAMPPGSVLINTARGDVLDDNAVIAALGSGHLGAAGLDVYRGEPAFNPRYLALDNVVLLPHLGSATRETREAMGHRVIDNLAAFFAGETPPDRVA